MSAKGLEVPRIWVTWFCPYAQRAWIAAEEKKIEYIRKETEGLYVGKKFANPNKPKDFLRVNPNGLVPAIELNPAENDGNEGQNVKGIYESLICVEYLDENYPNSGTRLFPQDPYQKAQARIWIAFIDNKIVPNFYKLLMNQNSTEQEGFKQTLEKNIATFVEAMNRFSSKGYFFGEEFSAVDIALLPHAWRMRVIIKHYRHWDVPQTEEFKRYHEWLNLCCERPSWKATQPDEAKLVHSYEGYSDGSATSTVAHQFVKTT